jgi:hypothetical protein
VEIETDSNRQGIFLYKNGSRYSDLGVSTSARTPSGSDLMYMNGTTDTAEIYVITSSGTPNVEGEADGFRTHFSGVWIRS